MKARIFNRRTTRSLAPGTRAMVNVDFSPALLLGMSLIAGGLALYQLRRLQPDISRDFDVIVSAVATFSGGILIFQVGVCSGCLNAVSSLKMATEALQTRRTGCGHLQTHLTCMASASGRLDDLLIFNISQSAC